MFRERATEKEGETMRKVTCYLLTHDEELRHYLLRHEMDIAATYEDFGDLKALFKYLFQHDPKNYRCTFSNNKSSLRYHRCKDYVEKGQQ
jgi:hypothetical protein